MKLSSCIPLLFVAFFSLTFSVIHAESGTHSSCTYGKLFVSDGADGSTVHVIDLNSGSNLTKETTVTVNGGAAANDLYVSANTQVVGVLYYGSNATNYTDGVVNWIHTGAALEEDGTTVAYTSPTALPNAAFDCVLPLHFTSNVGMIAIFCDGNYDVFSNSTIWVIDESKLSDTSASSVDENVIIYNTTILSSHHGNSLIIDDDHLLYSLASPDRIIRNVNGTDDVLASTFAVADLSGNVVYAIDDTSNVNTSCSGHHGITNTHHTAVLACDEIHGGVLMVSYDDTSKAYSSRALAYPVEGYRSFHFEQHNNASHIVGDLLLYDGATEELSSFHLFAFSTDDTLLTDSNIVKLPTEQYPCGFSYEKSEGNIVLVLVAEGLLLAYEFESSWTEVSRLQVVKNMTKCSQAVFASGYAQAFVLTTAVDNATIYAIDLSKIHTEGIMTTYATSSIDFLPYSAVVAGVPLSTACTVNRNSTGNSSSDDGMADSSSAGATVAIAHCYEVTMMSIIITVIVAVMS